MHSVSNLGEIGMPKQEPEFYRKVAASPIQSNPASSAIPSNAGLGDEPETFRQRWQAIVGGLHASDETTGDDAPAADSLREAGVAISGKEPAAIAANKGQVIKDTSRDATGKLAPERASTANATTLSPPIVLQSSPVPDATCVDPSHHPAKGSTGDFTSHAKRPSRRTDQSVAQNRTPGPPVQPRLRPIRSP